MNRSSNISRIPMSHLANTRNQNNTAGNRSTSDVGKYETAL